MGGQTDKQIHEVVLARRAEMRITGVCDVDSFDEASVVLKTVEGSMAVEGEDLKIGTLDTDRGMVVLSGKINGIYYLSDEYKEKRGIISRLFKQ